MTTPPNDGQDHDPRREIYTLIMQDKYRRRKLKQGDGNDLMPEWNPDDATQLYSHDELIEFLDGRIDGLLYAWDAITGWQYSDIASLILERENPFWRAEPYDWIDLSLIDTDEDERQCPWCGDIYRDEYLLWLDSPDWSDSELIAKVCDDCAEMWVKRPRVSKAQSERAQRVGGQTPIDGIFD